MGVVGLRSSGHQSTSLWIADSTHSNALVYTADGNLLLSMRNQSWILKIDRLHFVQSCFPNGFELDRFGGGNFYPFPPFLAKPLARMFPNLAWGIFLSCGRNPGP